MTKASTVRTPSRLERMAMNVLLDLRFGAILAGTISTRFAGHGANDVANADYWALDKLLSPEVVAGDVFVDIGCGKGRVVNWAVRHGAFSRVYGIELDREVAEAARKRLAPYRQVTIVHGDALVDLPSDGTLLYMYNPFGKDVVAKLRDRLAQLRSVGAFGARPRLIYYNPQHADVFAADKRFVVQHLERPRGVLPATRITFAE